MANDDIDIKISIKGDGSATSGLKKVEKGLDKVGKEANQAKTATSGLWKQFAGGALVMAGVTAGFRLLKSTIGDSIKAYQEQEKVERLLQVALKNTGDASKETFEDLKQFASGLQKITTVGDETTLKLMQLGLSMGIDTDKIKDATKQAIGLSKAFSIDLNSAMKMVTLAVEGDFTLLQRYIPALKLAKSATEKLAIANRVMADGFKIAQAETETMSGKLKQMENTVGDLKEKFGEAIARGILPILQDFQKWLAENEGEMISFFEDLGEAIKGIAVVTKATIKTINELNAAWSGFGSTFAKLGREMEAESKKIGSIFVDIANKMQEVMNNSSQSTGSGSGNFLSNAFKDIGESAEKAKEKGVKAFDQMRVEAQKLAKALEAELGIALSKLSTRAEDVREAFGSGNSNVWDDIEKGAVEGGDAITKGLFEPINKGLEDWTKNAIINTNVFEEFGEAFDNMNLADKVSFISNAFDQLGIDGGKAFDLLESGAKGFASLLSGDIVGGLAGLASTGFGIGKLLVPEKAKTEAEVFTDTANQFKEIYKWALLSTEQAKLVLQGTIEIEEAIGSNFQKLASEADNATREMFDFMNTAQEEGLKVVEIQAFINRNLVAGVNALGLYTGKFQTEFAEDFVNMLQAQGTSLQDIIEMMGENAPEALRKFAEANKKVLNNITGLDEILKSLGNTQNLTEENFKKIQNQGTNAFQRLIDNGATEEEALRSILPLLKDQIEFSELYGFGLSDNTKKLIEQAREAGLSFDDQKSASDLMVDGIDRIGDAIDRLVDLFSDDLPQAIGKSIGAVDVLGESMGSLPAPGSEFDDSAPGAGSRGGQSRNNNFNNPITVNNNNNIQGKNLNESKIIRIVEKGMQMGAGRLREITRKAVGSNG